MLSRSLSLFAGVFLAASVLGCGTALNFEKGGLENPKIYGGVACSLEMARTSPESSMVGPLYVLDVPISFVADTLTLPITVGAALVNSLSDASR